MQELIAGKPVERGVLHGQQSGAPDPLSDPLEQLQHLSGRWAWSHRKGRMHFDEAIDRTYNGHG